MAVVVVWCLRATPPFNDKKILGATGGFGIPLYEFSINNSGEWCRNFFHLFPHKLFAITYDLMLKYIRFGETDVGNAGEQPTRDSQPDGAHFLKCRASSFGGVC
jgi:hypothetical protein